jgi:hypothetical protein
MRGSAKLLALAALLALKPACGSPGPGSGTGVSWPVLPPLITSVPVAASLPGGAPALTPDLSGTVHPVDATSLQTDADVLSAIQGYLNGGGRITFTTTGGAPRTVKMSTPLLLNAGAPAVIVDGGGLITLDGNLSTGIFQLADNTTLTVQQLSCVNARTAQNGAAINGDFRIQFLTVINCIFDNCQTLEGGPDRGGGAIRAWNTQHTQISGCTFTGCAASNGGAVNSLGSRLSIIECTFNQNAAFGTGGGQDAGPSGRGGIGGAVYVDNVSNTPAALHQLLISGCVFNANVANDQAGAVFGYMTASTSSTMVIDATTFCGNVVGTASSGNGSGGAVYTLQESLVLTNSTFNANLSGGNGGGLRCDNVTSSVTNCTFQGNHANIGGAISKFSGGLTLQNDTVAQNTSDSFSAGIFAPGGTVTVNKSIFADNTATDPNNGWHTNTSFASGVGNIQWPSVTGATGIPITAPGTILGNPLLGTLGFHGLTPGPTYTMNLGAGSAAINAPPITGAPSTDQRGVSRSDGSPDAGSYEYP